MSERVCVAHFNLPPLGLLHSNGPRQDSSSLEQTGVKQPQESLFVYCLTNGPAFEPLSRLRLALARFGSSSYGILRSSFMGVLDTVQTQQLFWFGSQPCQARFGTSGHYLSAHNAMDANMKHIPLEAIVASCKMCDRIKAIHNSIDPFRSIPSRTTLVYRDSGKVISLLNCVQFKHLAVVVFRPKTGSMSKKNVVYRCIPAIQLWSI